MTPHKKKPKTAVPAESRTTPKADSIAPAGQHRQRSRSRSARRQKVPSKKKLQPASSAHKGQKVQVVERTDAQDLSLTVSPKCSSKTEVVPVAQRASSDPPKAYLQRKEQNRDFFDFWKGMFGTADRLIINKASEYFYAFCL